MSQQMPAMPRPPSSQPNGGTIDDQVQTTEVYAGGRPGPGVRVYFTTGKGAKGSVFIPEAQYAAPNVIATVRAAANEMDQVHGASI